MLRARTFPMGAGSSRLRWTAIVGRCAAGCISAVLWLAVVAAVGCMSGSTARAGEHPASPAADASTAEPRAPRRPAGGSCVIRCVPGAMMADSSLDALCLHGHAGGEYRTLPSPHRKAHCKSSPKRVRRRQHIRDPNN